MMQLRLCAIPFQRSPTVVLQCNLHIGLKQTVLRGNYIHNRHLINISFSTISPVTDPVLRQECLGLHALTQGFANCDPRGTSGPESIFVNKVLFEHSHIHIAVCLSSCSSWMISYNTPLRSTVLSYDLATLLKKFSDTL